MNLDVSRLNEQKKYEWLAVNNISYGATNHGKPFLSYILEKASFPLIDIGCGRNNFISTIKQRIKDPVTAIGIDFAFKEANIICPANNIPIQSNFFHTITSFDFFEHLIEEDVDYVIQEIIRIASNKALFFATISSKDSINRGPNGETLHPTIKDTSWWVNKLNSCGIKARHQSSNLYEGEIIK